MSEQNEITKIAVSNGINLSSLIFVYFIFIIIFCISIILIPTDIVLLASYSPEETPRDSIQLIGQTSAKALMEILVERNNKKNNGYNFLIFS